MALPRLLGEDVQHAVQVVENHPAGRSPPLHAAGQQLVLAYHHNSTSGSNLVRLAGYSPTPTSSGTDHWHGDWVSWNLAGLRGEAYAWDWEYSDPSAPVGFDLLHWHFQHRLAQDDGNLENATLTLDRATTGLAALGVPPAGQRLTASLYLLEMLTRALGLAADGNGWNPKLYPSLLHVAARRDWP